MGRIDGRLRSFSDSWWAVAVIVLLTGIIVLQQWQLRHPQARQPIAPQVGEHLPPVEVVDLKQGPIRIDWTADNRPTILYVLSPTCVWCAKNLDLIRALSDAAEPKYRFIGLSLDRKGLTEYAAKSSYRFPVYFAEAKSANQLKLAVTPETVVVSPKGTVVKVWRGAYDSEILSDIQKTLGVTLPVGGGLSTTGASPL